MKLLLSHCVTTYLLLIPSVCVFCYHRLMDVYLQSVLQLNDGAVEDGGR